MYGHPIYQRHNVGLDDAEEVVTRIVCPQVGGAANDDLRLWIFLTNDRDHPADEVDVVSQFHVLLRGAIDWLVQYLIVFDTSLEVADKESSVIEVGLDFLFFAVSGIVLSNVEVFIPEDNDVHDGNFVGRQRGNYFVLAGVNFGLGIQPHGLSLVILHHINGCPHPLQSQITHMSERPVLIPWRAGKWMWVQWEQVSYAVVSEFPQPFGHEPCFR